MPHDENATLRILDASLNRAAEGLRVCDDYVRFVLDDAHLTSQLKDLRHDLARLRLSNRLNARETASDVGARITNATETQRDDAYAVCTANFERVKQSLRSLEEYGKIVSPEFAAQFEQLRYRLYAIEAAIGRTVDALERLASVRLCVLIDGRESSAAFVKLIGQLVEAGVGMLQFRDKRLDDKSLVERGRLLVEKGRDRVIVIINDRPDVAAAVGADGVHLGQDDLSVKASRGIVGPRKLIGVSTHSMKQARAAVLAGANYLGAGPMFPSQSKAFDEFPGLDYLRAVAAEIRLPTFAIGGIDAENLSDVLATGARRVAVGAAIVDSKCIGEAASGVVAALNNESMCE